jgi:hypothetical protein
MSSVIWALIGLMMEAASISETSVNFYETAQCNNPEDSHLFKVLGSLYRLLTVRFSKPF